MKISLTKRPEIWRTITAEIYTDGEGTTADTYELKFRVPTPDEFEGFAKKQRDEAEKKKERYDDTNLISEYVIDWRGFFDVETGEEIPFTKENFKAACKYNLPILTAANDELLELVSGGAIKKFSQTSQEISAAIKR